MFPTAFVLLCTAFFVSPSTTDVELDPEGYEDSEKVAEAAHTALQTLLFASRSSNIPMEQKMAIDLLLATISGIVSMRTNPAVKIRVPEWDYSTALFMALKKIEKAQGLTLIPASAVNSTSTSIGKKRKEGKA